MSNLTKSDALDESEKLGTALGNLVGNLVVQFGSPDTKEEFTTLAKSVIASVPSRKRIIKLSSQFSDSYFKMTLLAEFWTAYTIALGNNIERYFGGHHERNPKSDTRPSGGTGQAT